jgi:hypothetical protein
MFRKVVLVCALVSGAVVSGIAAKSEAVVPEEAIYSCMEHVLCDAIGMCGGVAWSRVGNCGMQCWNGGENGQITPGVFVQCKPEDM